MAIGGVMFGSFGYALFMGQTKTLILGGLLLRIVSCLVTDSVNCKLIP